METPGKKNRWQIRVAALVIFLLGFAGGILAVKAYNSWARSGVQVTRQDRFEEMLKSLNLTADQDAQVRQILGDTRKQLQALRREAEPRVSEIRRQADERMQQVLTPEQWQQFQQMREVMRGRGRRGRGR